MRIRYHADPAQVDLPMLMHALSEPLRLQIIEMLDRKGETTCATIYQSLNISKTAASHHFRVLRESGVLQSRTSGRDQYASLRRSELDLYFPGILDAVLYNLRSRSLTTDPG